MPRRVEEEEQEEELEQEEEDDYDYSVFRNNDDGEYEEDMESSKPASVYVEDAWTADD